MKSKRKANPLATQIPLAILVLAAAWMFIPDQGLLILIHLIVLAYIVYALVKRAILFRERQAIKDKIKKQQRQQQSRRE